MKTWGAGEMAASTLAAMRMLFVFGPLAVGKMTVGREICRLTGYRLFHNHLSIEPLLGIFDFGTPSFNRLNLLIRHEIIAEAIAADLPGLVFTYAWAFDEPGDAAAVERYIAPVVESGGQVDFIELYAAADVRLAREGTPDRVDHKRSKRDVEWARAHQTELGERHQLNTVWPEDGGGATDLDPALYAPAPELLTRHPHHRFANDGNDPAALADRIVTELNLPRLRL